MLAEVGAESVPMIDVFNKIDEVDPVEIERRRAADPNALWISARLGAGREELLARVAAELAMDAERAQFTLDDGRDDDRRLIADLYRHARVVSHTTADGRVSIEADVPRRWLNRFTRARVPA